jgi:hypothetical protein
MYVFICRMVMGGEEKLTAVASVRRDWGDGDRQCD